MIKKIKHDNQYLSYIIDDNSHFFPTGYRVLNKQKDKGFIPCSKISYNGHIKLLYPVGEYVSVFAAAEDWKVKEVIQWMLHILRTLMDVRDNGFLCMENVDLDLSRIFIDVQSEKVQIIVLPLNTDTVTAMSMSWEEKLKQALLSIIEISQIRSEQESTALKTVIRENISSLDQIFTKLRQLAADMQIHTILDDALLKADFGTRKNYAVTGELHLLTRNSVKKENIAITKDVFILGKNPKLSDYVLNMSPTISRQHCKITRDDNGYYIEDLDSLNHTYVNGEIVQKGHRVPIQPGAQIRLAEVEFSAEFRN